ncbi:N-6 DNA Methylase [Bradyrhizobium lablabi]|uniref:site-specific DNA-methyltransferase (adenine-specific) n=1 Tax=Bradyrhizobium lablabi TaxID=722472 RepID=A0A1M6VMX6_9BRAD|nr:type ISP restriction/modification enzyme [Bradyrhizobium lablabi]SHK82596.1 N-6 DNA Methylase [Bradyrhizobium lablabi]
MNKPKAADYIREYLVRMAEIRGTGGATKETSYYSALENLLNHFGKDLRPRVICNGQLRNQGAGNPDFGLYTKTQLQGGEPRPAQIPERGVIEVKGLADKNWQTAKSAQATKYFGHYHLVLVTNYREFRLIGEDENGKATELEHYVLAIDEPSFWSMTANPALAVAEHAVHFEEFLRRVMMTAAPLVKAQDVAWFLASYARDALQTLNAKGSGTLDPLRKALETALGIKFEGEEGDHFFKSTLIQTLFYGVFSAWVVYVKQSINRFDWRAAAYTLTVPMVKALFEQIATPSKLGALGLIPILDRTAEALNRVDQKAFFKTFDTGEAVQHFYEPFLQAFDPELRKSLGVWYTPNEIVTYMVERVDHVLRTELGRPNGLADKDVYVLDPCCGTGTYVVAVLKRIEKTLRAQGEDALLADDIKQAARDRVFGFELLSAPFVVAHWQVGNYLAQIGAPLDAAHGERASIYLTNSLTGWEPPKGPKANLPLFPELEQERDAAEHVKRDVPLLVVLGNPPYNAFSGTSPEEEQGLVEPYKDGLIKKWGIKKFNLDELYVRFMRVSQRRIAEGTKQGVVCYISSFSYLSDPSFVVMRQRLLNDFDKVWIDCLNGDSRETGKKTPTGEPDPSVFSTSYNPAGIRLGTSIGLFTRKLAHSPAKAVSYRDFWGKSKREDLLNSLTATDLESSYLQAQPNEENRFSLRPQDVSDTYRSWPKVTELAELSPIAGLQEMRFGALLAHGRAELEASISNYLNPKKSWAEVVATASGPIRDAGAFDAETSRTRLLSKEPFSASNIRRYSLYPMDNRWAYWSAVPTLWNRARPQLVSNAFSGNQFLVVRMSAERPDEGVPAMLTASLPDYHLLRPNVVAIPLMVEHHVDSGLFAAEQKANLSSSARKYLRAIGCCEPDSDPASAKLVWYHALAIFFSPQYLKEHRDGVLTDWPRVPLPSDLSTLQSSAALGQRIGALLDPDLQVAGVTSGTIDSRLVGLGALSRVDGKALKPVDLSLSAGWGHRTTKGIIMPGAGRTRKGSYDPQQSSTLSKTDVEALGAPIDIMLNDVATWLAVPSSVWEYRIGGYQVVKKWLSYREESVLGRPLTKDEAREVTAIVRRLASIILMADELDSNYVVARDDAFLPAANVD